MAQLNLGRNILCWKFYWTRPFLANISINPLQFQEWAGKNYLQAPPSEAILLTKGLRTWTPFPPPGPPEPSLLFHLQLLSISPTHSHLRESSPASDLSPPHQFSPRPLNHLISSNSNHSLSHWSSPISNHTHPTNPLPEPGTPSPASDHLNILRKIRFLMRELCLLNIKNYFIHFMVPTLL